MQGPSKIFFYEGFRKRALRFLPRTPGCENSTAKAPLFWLIKSATIPLFCLEKFRSRALPQFLRTLSLATNETKMCARIRAHEVVKDFFSHRFRDFMCATSLLDAYFCSLWWWCAKNEQLYVQNVLKEYVQNVLKEAQNSKKAVAFATAFFGICNQ